MSKDDLKPALQEIGNAAQRIGAPRSTAVFVAQIFASMLCNDRSPLLCDHVTECAKIEERLKDYKKDYHLMVNDTVQAVHDFYTDTNQTGHFDAWTTMLHTTLDATAHKQSEGLGCPPANTPLRRSTTPTWTVADALQYPDMQFYSLERGISALQIAHEPGQDQQTDNQVVRYIIMVPLGAASECLGGEPFAQDVPGMIQLDDGNFMCCGWLAFCSEDGLLEPLPNTANNHFAFQEDLIGIAAAIATNLAESDSILLVH